MASIYVLAVVDRLFQRVHRNDLHFGGVHVVFAGDYRQTLHVIPRATRGKIISTTMFNTEWWESTTIFHLTRNYRIQPADDPENIEFAQYILDIGNNCGPVYSGATYSSRLSKSVVIPSKYMLPCDLEDGSTVNILKLIQWVYPDIRKRVSVSVDYRTLTTLAIGPDFTSRAILTPKLEGVKLINNEALQLMDGTPTTLCSCDKALQKINETQYPTHFINTMLDHVSGMPPHQLVLKIGSPVILLRNCDQARKFCNGTKLIVLKINRRLLTLRRVKALHDIIMLPRWKLQATGSTPFMCARTQFPVKLAFAFTKHKAQGQGIDKCGIFLPASVFAHGQLYVGMSRATNAKNIKVLMEETTLQGKCAEDHNFYTQNIVYDRVLQNISTNRTTIITDDNV